MWRRTLLISLILFGLVAGQDATTEEQASEGATEEQAPAASTEEQAPEESAGEATTEPVPGVDEPLVCPKYKCSDKETDTCLNYDDTTYTYTLGGCTGDLHCPYFPLNVSESVPCVTEDDPEIDDLTCIKYLKKNEVCVLGESFCHPDYFCKNNETNFYCASRVGEGKQCQALDECKVGHICNQGKCIKYWTVDDGEAADSFFACKSAAVKDGVCQATQKTVGDLPKKCQLHSDCTASNGAPGQCICVPDSKGHSYCGLHQSDDLTKEWLATASDGNVEKTAYLYIQAVNYPVIEKASDCYIDDAIDFVPYKKIKKWHKECKSAESSGVILAITATILALF
mmetsp:Transcript_5340/g.5299  ORF Transcript_5340/g.5299 Transcript_5340/m.5299 type:complete len:341 (+) Transcript_5340:15-1037(+)